MSTLSKTRVSRMKRDFYYGEHLIPYKKFVFEEIRNPFLKSERVNEEIISDLREFLVDLYDKGTVSREELRDNLFTRDYLYRMCIDTVMLILVRNKKGKLLGFASSGRIPDDTEILFLKVTMISEEVKDRYDLLLKLNVRMTIHYIAHHWLHHNEGLIIPCLVRTQNPMILYSLYRFTEHQYPSTFGGTISQEVRRKYDLFQSFTKFRVDDDGIQRNSFAYSMTPGGIRRTSKIQSKERSIRSLVFEMVKHLGERDFFIFSGDIVLCDVTFNMLEGNSHFNQQSMEDLEALKAYAADLNEES